MKTYLNFLRHIQDNGIDKDDRTGIGTRSVFAHQMRFDLSQGFPLLTTKKLHTRSIILELLWFLRGETNINTLGCGIWDEWANENGELGAIYGKQWRSWGSASGTEIDQISILIHDLKNRPNSRRHIVSAWNVGELEQMALPPCHLLFQFYIAEGKLSCQLYQRSADSFIGVPFNIASYALLTHMIAQQCDLKVGEFIWTGGDCHIYQNHFEQVKTQLQRQPFALPQLQILHKPASIFDYQLDDFSIENYQAHPHIKAQVAVWINYSLPKRILALWPN